MHDSVTCGTDSSVLLSL